MVWGLGFGIDGSDGWPGVGFRVSRLCRSDAENSKGLGGFFLGSFAPQCLRASGE